MAEEMTFTSLSDEILGWFERAGDTFLAANIPAIISDAESNLGRELKPLGFETSYSGEMIPNQPWLLKPNRWRGTVSMTVLIGAPLQTPDGQVYDGPPYAHSQSLLPRSVEYCRRVWPKPDTANVQNPPLYYADWEWGRWYIAPTPVFAYPFEVIIYNRPLPLDESHQTNWLTENAPDLMRNACMARASRYLKNPDAASAWQADLDRAINGLGAEDARRIVDRASNPEKSP